MCTVNKEIYGFILSTCRWGAVQFQTLELPKNCAKNANQRYFYIINISRKSSAMTKKKKIRRRRKNIFRFPVDLHFKDFLVGDIFNITFLNSYFNTHILVDKQGTT